MMLYSTIEKALNQVCSLNPHADKCLQRLADKTVVFALTFPKLAFSLQFTKTTIAIKPRALNEYDLKLSGTVPAFIHLQLSPNKSSIDKLDIDGEFILAQDISQLFSYANIDWEALLAQHVGDIAAYNLSQVLHKTIDYHNNLRATLTRNLNNYLQEELRILPTLAEADQFYRSIDLLRDDVERLLSHYPEINAKGTPTC